MKKLFLSIEFIKNAVITHNKESNDKSSATTIVPTMEHVKGFIQTATEEAEPGYRYDVTVTIQKSKVAAPKIS